MDKLKKRYSYSFILLRELVITDFKLRYQGSSLGYLWSILRPLALFVILYIIFAKFLRIGDSVPNFPIYLLLGIVIWNYFAEVTTGSVGAIVGKGDLIRKINFPKHVIVLAVSISALINLLLNSLVIVVFIIASDITISSSILFLPLLVLELFLVSLAVGLFLSAAFVRLRDINYIWEVIMQGAFYATPILYPLTLIPLLAAKVLLISPVAQIIQDARHIVVTPETQTISDIYDSSLIRLVPIILTIVLFIGSIFYFRSRSKFFAEEA